MLICIVLIHCPLQLLILCALATPEHLQIPFVIGIYFLHQDVNTCQQGWQQYVATVVPQRGHELLILPNSNDCGQESLRYLLWLATGKGPGKGKYPHLCSAHAGCS